MAQKSKAQESKLEEVNNLTGLKEKLYKVFNVATKRYNYYSALQNVSVQELALVIEAGKAVVAVEALTAAKNAAKKPKAKR